LVDRIAILPPLVSPADIRELYSIGAAMGANPILVPDISDALDGGAWSEYLRLPPGGVALSDVASIGAVAGVVDLGAGRRHSPAAQYLENYFSRTVVKTDLPIGIRATDALCDALASVTGKTAPPELVAQRSRLIDAYFDGHKYVSGKRAAIVGDIDLCAALALWCAEVGITPALVATNGAIPDTDFLPEGASGSQCRPLILRGADFDTITAEAKKLSIDICFGSGKTRGMALDLGVPLIRVGFPIHDRFGASRILTIGYNGAMELFDRVVNAIIEKKQAGISGGYSYL
jgi:nitrogenase molybdenum-iron protein NifN